MKRDVDPVRPIDEQEIVRSVLRVSDSLGLREWVRGLDYFRCVEYPIVVEALRPTAGKKLLDMGCGTGPFTLFLTELGFSVEAFDLDPVSISWQARGAQKLGLGRSSFSATTGDSRCLPHADETFDAVLNLGSIEHIRDDGDSVAAREMARVLKPGGRAVLTIPFGPQCVEIEAAQHVPGFERRYDDEALLNRLIRPSNLVETARIYFGEPGFAASSIWYSIPKLIKLAFRRFTPRLSRRWLTRIAIDDRERACGVCLVLDKAP